MSPELQADLKRLEEMKVELDRLTQVKQAFDELKEQVRFELEAAHLKSVKTAKINVGIAERKSLQITSEPAVIAWLEDNKFEVDEYLRLDPDRIKALAEARLKETGEIVEGTQFVTTEYISVRGVK